MTLPQSVDAQHRGTQSGGRVPVSTQRTEKGRAERGTSAGRSSTRPGSSSARPGNAGSGRHGGSVGNRPGSQGTHTGGGRPDRPGANRPGNSGSSVRPGHGGGGSGNRPGGSSGLRPGHGGHNHGGRPSGTSAPRPGTHASRPRPHYDYRVPGYRPPRPGGGYWGTPCPNPHRVVYRVPPVPRYVYVPASVPTLGTILGLTFGSFIDAGINSLYNAGYNVSGYLSDAIYLSNVRQMGYMWPEVMVHYTDGLMSGTQFYNWSMMPDMSRYDALYRQLTGVYGMPVETSYTGGATTTTWWAGGGTGYVTLQYGYGPSASGVYSYYTSLTYSSAY